MARVFFYGLPVSGHMHPALGVVQELVRRGHEVVTYATPSWSDRIKAVGAQPRVYDDPSLERVDPPENAFVTLALALRVAKTVLPALVRDIEDVPASDRPDLLMIDSAAPWGVILARRTGLPSVTSSTTFAINGPVSRRIVGDVGRIVPMLFQGGAAALLDAMRSRRDLRRAWGVEPPRLPEIVGAPSTEAMLAYTSRGFQPLSHTFGTDTHFVGPVLDARRETWSDPLPPGFLYVSLGTLYHHNPSFFRMVLEATRDLDADVLLNIGSKLDPAHFPAPPPHVRIVQGVPQVAVLERAGAFITHGGMNSVHESLLAGVPMVVAPQAVDQFLVADRVAEVGAGIALETRRLSSEAIRKAVDRVFADPSYASAARAVGAELRAAGGARRAADVVESVLERSAKATLAPVH